MKKIICLLICFLLMSVSKAETIKFIQVTDVHLTKNNYSYLTEFVNEVNNDFNDLDFVVFTGDNINRANGEDLLLFLKIIKKLKVKSYVVLGNHDLEHSNGMTKENYMRMVRKNLGFYHSSKSNYVFQKKDIVFIVMNGVKEYFPSPNGYYKQDELRWLDKKLTKYKDKKVVIIQHFPLIDTTSAVHNLWKKEDYLEVLKKHNNVISIISGHYHKNFEISKNGIYNIITKNFLNNKYYKIIEIDSMDGFIFTSLIEN